MDSRLNFLIGMILMLFLGGCGKEEGSGTDAGGAASVPVTLVLSHRVTPSVSRSFTEVTGGISLTYETEAMPSTRSLDQDPDYRINDLIVLQFNESGTMVYRTYLTSTELTGKISGDYLVYTPELELEPLPGCTVYAVANTGDPTLFPQSMSFDTFKAEERSLPDESSLLSGGVPMSGYYTGEVDGETGFRIDMQRMLAKMELTVNIGTLSDGRTLELNSAQWISIPTITRYHNQNKDRPAQDVIRYPEDNAAYMEANLTDYEARQLDPGTTLTWYMPENVRGPGFLNSATEKQKYALWDPTYWDDPKSENTAYQEYEAGFASRLWLSGKYTTPEKGKRNILITLYPGADVTQDFTVSRNALYRITANITDINPKADGGDDYRIYLSDPGPSGSLQSLPHKPEIFPVMANAMWVMGEGSYYLHPGETITKASVVIIFPSGATEEHNHTGNLSQEGENTIDYFIMVPGRIYAYEEIKAYTKLEMSTGDILTSETATTLVRPLN